MSDDESRLENPGNGDLCCDECGIAMQAHAAIVLGYDRCPECILEAKRKELRNAFGSLSTAQVALSFEVPPEEFDSEEADEVTP